MLKEGQSLTVALENAFKTIDSAQDKALVQAICYGVCRYYHRLDFILNALIDKPLKATEAKALLLVGLYQLAYMRVKPHAAVSETVHAARNVSWAKALVNGVLRNYIRKQAEFEQAADKDKTAALSHPDWLINALEYDWPEHAQDIMAENNHAPPMTLRINQTKICREDYLQGLHQQGLSAQTLNFCPSAIILEKPVPVENLPGFAEGWFSVQDAAAQLAATLLEVLPGQTVLDTCAAPGGKTSHILELQPRLQTLVAVDNDEGRMRRVKENLTRLGQEATLIIGDATQPGQWWDGKPFDRILLDAPCSATGVIRRHPDIKLLRRAEDIETLAILQSKILNALWPLLAPGGLLLYATCSVLKQENELQIKNFLTTHQDAKELPLENCQWGIRCVHGRQILTGESSMDGFYYARIVKQ